MDMARASRRPVASSADGDAGGGGQSEKGLRNRGGMQELLRALEVYTERHFKRMEELVDESYLIEYTLREMDEVVGGLELRNGHGSKQGKDGRDGMDGDVITF